MNHPRRALVALLLVSCSAGVLVAKRLQTAAPAAFFPARGDWPKHDPALVGFDKAKLDDAVAYAVAHETTASKDLAVATPQQFRNEAPYNALIGPTKVRAAANGLVIRHGYVAAEWGDTASVDMTYSITKTFLSTVVGLAFDRGKIRAVTDRAATYMPKGVDLFAAEHNAPITWEHLLRQTSDWSGTLWGKPDWADRPPAGVPPDQWPNRQMHEPGTFYKYNDTRVNVLSLATLYVMKQPLPEILKASVMDPIGASSTWHWESYKEATVTIDGRSMVSVPGGGHFGGGMFISAYDLARFGYLFLHNGKWADRQIVSEKWIGMARTPGPANAGYGYCNWFLNNPAKRADGTEGNLPFPAAPRSSVTFQGNGINIVYIDWEHDIVAVVRWFDSNRSVNEFLSKVLGSITK